MTTTPTFGAGPSAELRQAWMVLIAPYLGTVPAGSTVPAGDTTTTAEAAGYAAGEALLASWTEPFRQYHDLSHLRHVLAEFDALAAHAAHPDAVRLAAWYHDVIYHGLPDDEHASADRAEAELRTLGLDPELVVEVGRLVRLTATHHPAPGDRNGAVLCDADLAVLASPPRRYARYTANIRAEYAHLPEGDYRTGRVLVVRALLAKPTLFHTPRAKLRYETPARANLTAELATLTN